MSDIGNEFKMPNGELVKPGTHHDAYNAFTRMSRVAQEQVFKHVNSEHGGRFIAHVDGADREYGIGSNGLIFRVH